jgi:hypothetical protein
MFQIDPEGKWSKAVPGTVIAILLLIGFFIVVAWRWLVFVLIVLAFVSGAWLFWGKGNTPVSLATGADQHYALSK